MAQSMAVDWAGNMYSLDTPKHFDLHPGNGRLHYFEVSKARDRWVERYVSRRSYIRAKNRDDAEPTELVGGGEAVYVIRKARPYVYGMDILIRGSYKANFALFEAQTGGAWQFVATKRSGDFYVLTSDGIYRRPFSPRGGDVMTARHKIGGPAEQIFAGLDTIYATSPDRKNVYRYDPDNNSWSWFFGEARSISVDRGGTVYLRAADGNIYQKRPGAGFEVLIGGGHSDDILSAGRAGELYMVDTEGGSLYRFDTYTKSYSVISRGDVDPWKVHPTPKGVFFNDRGEFNSLRGSFIREEPVSGGGNDPEVIK